MGNCDGQGREERWEHEFQKRKEQAFDGLKGLCILVDDILTHGRTQKKHDERLKEVLQRAKNRKKIQQNQMPVWTGKVGERTFRDILRINYPLKATTEPPSRIQRLRTPVQPDDLTVLFLPGSNIPVPDAFSRLHFPDRDETLHADIEVFVHTVVNDLPVSHTKLQEIKDKTKSDL
ncbi:hypothetical protein QYM36_013989 [Artemia franciscana]|uniref:Uncharacterized protein n=1 Tax=Artemia franciscana TaxID=6661 RepID=A0AA88KXP6_ARTSF|nr:hypothetical protein QYM36_013989 [Artemia franciscana]